MVEGSRQHTTQASLLGDSMSEGSRQPPPSLTLIQLTSEMAVSWSAA